MKKIWWIDPPTDSEIEAMVVTLATRVIRFLKKKGYFQDAAEAALPEEGMIQEELLPDLQAASVQSRIALGERKGQKVRRLGIPEFADFQPELKGPLRAITQGFSLHAEVYCAPGERVRQSPHPRLHVRTSVAGYPGGFQRKHHCRPKTDLAPSAT